MPSTCSTRLILAAIILTPTTSGLRAEPAPCGDGRIYERPSETPAARHPSVTFGKMFGLDAEGRALGTIEDETRAIFNYLRSILAEHGLAVSDIDDIQVFLADMAELPRFNAVLKEYFTGTLPLCVALEGGAGFPPFNARIQMNGHAAKN